jgi:hypothetical protein
MARLGINTGNNPNDGQGDPLRIAMGKINSNFTEIYSTFGDGSDLDSIPDVAENLTGNPIINVSGILNVGVTTTEHIEVRNITSTGIVTAVQFVGDGSQLSNVTALVAGLEVLDDNIRRGIARELNFGDNIITTGPDGVGRVTIAATGSNVSPQFVTTSAGIHTLSNVGIGTTNPIEKLTVSGTVQATSFVGEGSGLTGVVAVGSGVVIQEEGSIVGTATTINFRSNLEVSFSSGVADIDVITDIATDSEKLDGELPSYYLDYDNFTNTPSNLSDFNNDVGFITTFTDTNYWTKTSSGIHTLSNVGIGTTNPIEKLTVVGDARVTGILTVGSASITLNGATNTINVGSGVTINGSTGTINATSINLGGTILTNLPSYASTSYVDSALVGYATEGYVTTQIGINTFTGAASTITSGQISNWNTAYGWGDHTLEGYITSYTETDPLFTASVAFGISSTDTSNWDTAYSWGDHSTVGYASTSYVDSAVVGFITAGALTGYATTGSIVGFITAGALTGAGGTWSVNSVGIHTSKNVGIGTTLSSSALTVEGDGRFSGIVTATRFESISAGTPTIDSPNNLNINAINVAISTDLTVGGDAYVGVDTSSGLILTSPNGTQYRLVVDNSGNLSTVLVP